MLEEIRPGYTRVSTILSQWDKFSGILPEILENKIRIGTNVHKAIDAFHLGLLVELADDEQPYFNSFFGWYNEVKYQCMQSEKRLYDDSLKITGELDALVKLGDSKELTLLDWKCSYSEDPINWPLQGAFYIYLLRQNGHENVSDVCMFVKLSKESVLPKVFEYDTSNLLPICKAAVQTYEYQKIWLEKRKKGIREW